MPLMVFDDEEDEPLFAKDIGASNVVDLDSKRPGPKPPLPDDWFADRERRDYQPENMAPIPGQSISIADPVNQSLRLAAQQDFFGICSAILWGSEDREVFGELLRGLVIEFEPTNTFQLHLLAHIADATWNLRRLQGYRKTAFDSGTDQKGRYGMVAGTDFALDEVDRVRKYQASLKKAIETYRQLKD
jgi:hypothetical protein